MDEDFVLGSFNLLNSFLRLFLLNLKLLQFLIHIVEVFQLLGILALLFGVVHCTLDETLFLLFVLIFIKVHHALVRVGYDAGLLP